MQTGRMPEWRFSNLTPAAAVPAAGRRGVLHLLALGDGQVIEYLVRSGARRSGEARGQEPGPEVGVEPAGQLVRGRLESAWGGLGIQRGLQ